MCTRKNDVAIAPPIALLAVMHDKTLMRNRMVKHNKTVIQD